MLTFGIAFESVLIVFRVEVVMNRLFKKLEDIMVAVTFAEAGELDAAGEISDQQVVAEEAGIRAVDANAAKGTGSRIKSIA